MAKIDHSPSRRIRSLNWMIQKELTGDQTNRISDGSHTFGDLYFHRAVLFAALLKAYPDKSWRSKVQSDGHGFPGYFLCGIQTPEGQYTYHYQLSQWDLFDGVRELPESPDDLPVIPKAVGEWLTWCKRKHHSLKDGLDGETRVSEDVFARAWLLGVWRVEETGEIVKLEAKK